MEKDMEKTKKILIVVTNTSDSGDLHKTGVWLEEFAVPYYAFQDEGYEVTVASPLGGVAPIDENSLECKILLNGTTQKNIWIIQKNWMR